MRIEPGANVYLPKSNTLCPPADVLLFSPPGYFVHLTEGMIVKNFSRLINVAAASLILVAPVVASAQAIDPDNIQSENNVTGDVEAPEPAQLPDKVEAPEPAQLPDRVEAPEPAQLPDRAEAPEPAQLPGQPDAPDAPGATG